MKKKILWLIALIILGIICYVGFSIYQFKEALSGMKPLPTKEIIKDVYAINNKYVNFYLIKSGTSYLAIDAGADIEQTKAELAKLNIDAKDVKAVLLTHSDRDHVASLSLFPNARIYLSKDEVQMINGKRTRMANMKNSAISKYTALLDNQIEVIAGKHIRTVATSGHTPGSMCYIIDGNMIFTGDSLGMKNGKVTVFNIFFNMDTETEIKSINKIAKFEGIKYVFTAHNGFSDNFEDVMKK